MLAPEAVGQSEDLETTVCVCVCDMICIIRRLNKRPWSCSYKLIFNLEGRGPVTGPGSETKLDQSDVWTPPPPPPPRPQAVLFKLFVIEN